MFPLRFLTFVGMLGIAASACAQSEDNEGHELPGALNSAFQSVRQYHGQKEESRPAELPVVEAAFRPAENRSTPSSNLPPLWKSGREWSQDDIDAVVDSQVESGPTPWWAKIASEPLGERDHEMVDPDMLVQLALHHSPSILAISQNPLIQETEIGVARAKFDPDLFLKTLYDDRVDPVGNQLTTGGGLPFLKDHIWYGESGLRRKLYSGADVELKQRLGFQNSNSNFFDPQDQGTATLSLNFAQPLMRGRGECYNRSQIMIAQSGTQAAWDKLAAELQDELTRLVEAYWTLYYSRAVLLQKRQNVERGEVVLLKLEARSSLDSLPSQIARARAAVRARVTELANARRDVYDAETEIRKILGSTEAFRSDAPELVPAEAPVVTAGRVDLENVITEAMSQRPEVKQVAQRARIAAIQQNVSRNELMPELNLIFNTYVSALRGDSDIPGAWADQFQNATPGFAGGLEFSLPWGRRAARCKLTRQQLIVQQTTYEIDQVMHQVVAEAQTAWRQRESALQTVVAASAAIEAARADLLQNEARWESFALVEGDLTEGQNPTSLLDQLLDAQQRLTNAELTYSQALLEFKVAEIALKRATGTLLNYYSTPAWQPSDIADTVIEETEPETDVAPDDGEDR